MDAMRKAPQGYRLCEGRLRPPTFILSTEHLKLTKENLNLDYGPADGQGMARTCRMVALATRMPPRRLRRGYAGTRTRIRN